MKNQLYPGRQTDRKQRDLTTSLSGYSQGRCSLELQSRRLQSRAMDFGAHQPVICLEAIVWEATALGATISEATVSGYGFWISPPIYLSGGYNLGGCSPGGYTLRMLILDLANHSLVWRLQSGRLQSGRLQFQRLQSQATGDYNLGD